MTNKSSGAGNTSRGGGGGNSKAASTRNRSPKVKAQSKIVKGGSTGAGSRGKAGNAGSTGGGPPKRARSSAAATREAKRARTEAGSKPGTPRTSTPTSPTSSRSRPRKQSAGPATTKASAKAAGNPGALGKPPAAKPRASTSRQMASRNTLTQQANVNLFIDGMSVPADIKNTNVVRRLFGQEIQCVMHSFGETRACSRDTLELVEDAVRAAVRRVIGEAAFIADIDSVGGPVTLEVHHIAHIIRRDSRAMNRFNQTIRLAAEQYVNRPEGIDLRKYCKNRAAPKPWDTIAELADLGDGNDNGPSSQGQYIQDPWKYCTWKAYHVFRSLMPQPTFNDYVKCRSTNLVTGVSRSQWARIAEHPRFLMFQRWLDLDPQADEVKISLGALYALGHIAWECIGVLTQTALIQMHFDAINTGTVELRCSEWSYARHLLASLGHGIATAVLVPLTDIQLQYLRQEVERLPMLALMGPDYWKGTKASAPKSLSPKHIREALRRDDFADSVLLSIIRDRYGSSFSY